MQPTNPTDRPRCVTWPRLHSLGRASLAGNRAFPFPPSLPPSLRPVGRRGHNNSKEVGYGVNPWLRELAVLGQSVSWGRIHATKYLTLIPSLYIGRIWCDVLIPEAASPVSFLLLWGVSICYLNIPPRTKHHKPPRLLARLPPSHLVFQIMLGSMTNNPSPDRRSLCISLQIRI